MRGSTLVSHAALSLARGPPVTARKLPNIERTVLGRFVGLHIDVLDPLINLFAASAS